MLEIRPKIEELEAKLNADDEGILVNIFVCDSCIIIVHFTKVPIVHYIIYLE